MRLRLSTQEDKKKSQKLKIITRHLVFMSMKMAANQKIYDLFIYYFFVKNNESLFKTIYKHKKSKYNKLEKKN